MARIKATVNGSCEGSPLELYTVNAVTSDGRRFWYCYPDGLPRDGFYLRELTLNEFNRLCDGVRVAGGIDPDKACWQEGDPVYGSTAYEESGLEMAWANREREEAAWM